MFRKYIIYAHLELKKVFFRTCVGKLKRAHNYLELKKVFFRTYIGKLKRAHNLGFTIIYQVCCFFIILLKFEFAEKYKISITTI